MGNHGKLLETILRGSSDANIAFDDIRGLLVFLGLAFPRWSTHRYTQVVAGAAEPRRGSSY